MIFGVDVGGTTVKIGLVENHKLIDKYEIPTKKETLIKDICLSIQEYNKKHHLSEPQGIGFGLPGMVIKNYVYKLPNIGIGEFDLEKEVKNYFPNAIIASSNDANVAALGEMLYHKECENACMITIGTGVGGGIVLGGKVLEGSHGCAGEVGHMPIALDYGFQCTCRLTGCLETVASATGVVRLAKYHYLEYHTKLKEPFAAKDVFDYAKKKDELASFVVDKVAFYLARCIAAISLVADVDVCYIGGGVSKAGDILIDLIKNHYQKISHYGVKTLDIKVATLLNDAGMIGAAGLLGDLDGSM